jgi:hypothetical protein
MQHVHRIHDAVGGLYQGTQPPVGRPALSGFPPNAHRPSEGTVGATAAGGEQLAGAEGVSGTEQGLSGLEAGAPGASAGTNGADRFNREVAAQCQQRRQQMCAASGCKGEGACLHAARGSSFVDLGPLRLKTAAQISQGVRHNAE